MGTNYFLHPKEPSCPTCGREFDSRHIGKSSAGWCFSLRVYPAENIRDLDDWERVWSEPFVSITNEYGDKISVEEMRRIITERCRKDVESMPTSWFRENDASPGPCGLARHKLGARTGCISWGKGTWDCIEREFS